MDGALLKTLNAFPAKGDARALTENPNFTQSNVAKADISVFHQSPRIDTRQDEGELELDYEAGLRDGKAQSDLVYQNTISVMQSALDGLQQQLSLITQQIEADHLRVLDTCLKGALPALGKLGTSAEVLDLIARTAEAGLGGQLHFKVHPDGLKECQRLCELQGEAIQVTADASLAETKIDVSWDGGGASIDAERILQDFLAGFDAVVRDIKVNSGLERHHG